MINSVRQSLPKWPEIIWISSKRKDLPKILGINPWVYDFAAYNFWARPVGLISCLMKFKEIGCDVALLDCMIRMWRDVPWTQDRRYGLSAYPRTEIPKPYILKEVPRNFARYGLLFEAVKGALERMEEPDYVFLSTVMTYWYPGLVTMIQLLRKIFKRTKIVVGGIYPTLCEKHAENLLEADLIIKGPLEKKDNWDKLMKFMGLSYKMPDFRLSFCFYPYTSYAVIMGSRGCPFNCEYCASRRLFPGFYQRPLDIIWEEFYLEYERGIRDFAFYDDALLFNVEKWFVGFLERVIKNNVEVRFHCPNGLHIRYLDKEICKLMKRAGFKTIRLGLETANFQSRRDRKLTKEQWDIGVKNLLDAGFDKQDIGVYILFGLPYQTDDEIVDTIEFVKSYGFRPHLAYYTPIPGSKLYEQAKEVSNYPIDEDPICQNNAIWPCYPGGFSWEKRSYFRQLIQS